MLSDTEWCHQNLKYTRSDLRSYTHFREIDVSGVNPRRFHRELRRLIEELTEKRNFMYNVTKDPIDISIEAVGGKTGVVRGGIEAKGSTEVNAKVSYKPFKLVGGVGIGAGGMLLLFTYYNPLFFLLGLLIIVVGISLRIRKELGLIPFTITSLLRTLYLGEVTERKRGKEEEKITDIYANMSVTFAITISIRWDRERTSEVLLEQVNYLKDSIKEKGVVWFLNSSFVDTEVGKECKEELENMSKMVEELAEKTSTFVN